MKTISEALRGAVSEKPEAAGSEQVQPQVQEATCCMDGWLIVERNGRPMGFPCPDHMPYETFAERAGLVEPWHFWAGRRWPYRWDTVRTFVRAMRVLARQKKDRALTEHVEKLIQAARAVKDAVELAVALAKGEERPGTWALLSGGYGSGKTFLLKVAAVEAVYRRIWSRYWLMAEVVRYLQDAFGRPEPDALSKRLETLQSFELLALDEAEKVGGTDWRQEIMTMLWGRWYESALAGKRILLAATNLPLGDLPGYIASRAGDARFAYIELGDLDLRPYLDDPALKTILENLEKEG